MSKKYKFLSIVMSMVLLLSTLFIPAGSANAEELSEDEYAMIEMLSAIENMPDEVIAQGSEAIEEYLNQEVDFPIKSAAPIKNSGLSTRSMNPLELAGCASAIGGALITNLTPAKVLKAKSAIKAVGGATTFVKRLKPYYTMSREDGMSKSKAMRQAVSMAAQDAGPETRKALSELFAIGAVLGACSAVLD